MVTSLLSKPTNAVFKPVTRFLSIGVYGFMSWAMWIKAWEYMLTPEKAPVSANFQTPIVPFMFVTAAGIGILCLMLAVDFVRSLAEASGE